MDRPTANYYARHAGDLRLMYANAGLENADRLVRAFEGKKKILDIGCGTGRDLAMLLRKGKVPV